MEKITCQVCGAEFPRNNIVTIEGINVCLECKPIFLQKLREGYELAGKTVQDESLDKRFRSLRNIWFTLLGTVLLYLGVALVLPLKGRPTEASSLAIMRPALYAFAFICLIASQYVRKLMLSYIRRQLSSERPARQASASPQNSVSAKYQGAVVLPLVMCEWIAICGLYLFVRGRSDWISIFSSFYLR